MSILNKHPGPWRFDDDGGFIDANGSRLTGPASLRLILAAPELLAALKRVGGCCGCLDKEASALIDRIEKG